MSDDQESPATFASGVLAARFGERPYWARRVHEQPARHNDLNLACSFAN
ncbi:hypothetical protein M878_12710 [Streptomyces roseochromogenus subsp. oscitans DS 12.976]|uniref:Uncharacterized protein n=1 Tax=Streptomyces roseochromogenus subsp. oscitans DS 12.976 TaxID=1352936 RepID=V6KQ60_STRRC|nr:hypothetical protein M878_12710 [Streptomyces roseochromogenus subsp. oscitans DS 12.976]